MKMRPGNEAASICVAFSSNDRVHVNQHFGAAAGIVIHEIGVDHSHFVAAAEFPAAALDGDEDKLAERIEFVSDCAAVFVLAVGASAIRQLLARGVQPVRVEEGHTVQQLVAGIRTAMRDGGMAWVDKALATQPSPERFTQMASETWLD